MTTFVGVFIQFFLTALWLLVLGRVLMSWIDPQFGSGLARFLFQATEPILAPVRRLMPRTGMIDFSALIVLLILGSLLGATGRL